MACKISSLHIVSHLLSKTVFLPSILFILFLFLPLTFLKMRMVIGVAKANDDKEMHVMSREVQKALESINYIQCGNALLVNRSPALIEHNKRS